MFPFSFPQALILPANETEPMINPKRIIEKNALLYYLSEKKRYISINSKVIPNHEEIDRQIKELYSKLEYLDEKIKNI